MKRSLLIIAAVILLCTGSFAAESGFSYGVGGGIGFTNLFENPGGYYSFNSFMRIDSVKNLWVRTLAGQINLFGSVFVSEITTVLKYPLYGPIDVGFHVGATYDALSEDTDFLAGIEFEWCPYSTNGYEKITVTPVLSIVETEGKNYLTTSLFINFAP